MKRSLLAKILILVLCLSLVLCGCGKDDTTLNDDPTEAPTSSQTGDPTKPTENPDPEKPEDPKDPETPGTPDQGGSSLGDILENIFGGDIGGDDLQNAIEAGKVTITLGDMMTNVLYVDMANLKLVDQLSMNIEGTELSAQLYLNEHDLVVALPEMLPDAYGVSFDTLMEDLPNSAIWGMMGITYEEFVAQLAASLDDAMASLEDMMQSMDDLESMFSDAEKYLDSLTVALTEALENVEQTTTTGQANIYGQYVDAQIITYSVDSAAMEKMTNILLDWCAENADGLAGLLADGEITGQSIVQAITEAKNEVSSFFDSADLEASLVLNFNPETNYLMSIDGSFAGTVDGEDGGIYLNLTLGEDPTQSNLYTFKMHDHNNDGISVSFGYETVNTTTTYSLTASTIVAGDAADALILSLSYDTASYKYAVSLTADGEAFAVNGICKVTEEAFEFTIDSVTANGDVTEINLRLVAEAISAGEIPNAPSYINLLQMSEVDLTSLLMKLQGNAA